MKIKTLFGKVKTKASRYLASSHPVEYARKLGVTVDDSVKFTSIPDFGSEPWLIEIKANSYLAANVLFVTHDGSVRTVKLMDKKYLKTCKFGRIVLDEDCFIGVNTTILPNVHIGKGAIVGACSLVTKDIPAGEVWGGVPAKRICTVREMAEKWYAVCNANPEQDLYAGKPFRVWTTDVADLYWKATHGTDSE